MDLDAYMIQLNLWRKAVEGRLTALEALPSTASSGTSTADIAALRNDLDGATRVVIQNETRLDGSLDNIAAMEVRLAAVEAKANDANSILAKVEAALNVTHAVVPGTEPHPT
jgi:septal ring factor EnvC (AmiA/AmiB activator)